MIEAGVYEIEVDIKGFCRNDCLHLRIESGRLRFRG